MATILNGIIGGLVATVVMTAFMITFGDDSPPPTSVFWSEYIGDGVPEDYKIQGIALHLLYGIAAGGMFIVLTTALGLGVASFGGALVWSIVYGVVLFVAAAVFWMNIVLGLDGDAKMAVAFLFFHLIYGLVFGAWISFDLL